MFGFRKIKFSVLQGMTETQSYHFPVSHIRAALIIHSLPVKCGPMVNQSSGLLFMCLTCFPCRMNRMLNNVFDKRIGNREFPPWCGKKHKPHVDLFLCIQAFNTL